MIKSNGRHIEFGKGDIGIHMSDTSGVALLVFRNLGHPLPVGHMVGGNEKRVVELRKSDVVMSFSNADSIDALMKCLKVIRCKLCAAMPEKTGQEVIYE